MPGIQFGQIYEIADFPPLDGGIRRSRPAVVMVPNKELREGEDPILVIGITSADCTDEDRLPLPNRQEDGQHVKTGLDVPCCALPRWMVQVSRSKLVEYRGHLMWTLVEALEDSMVDRMAAGYYPILQSPDEH